MYQIFLNLYILKHVMSKVKIKKLYLKKKHSFVTIYSSYLI